MKNPPAPPYRQRGFALVIALSLMAFILVLLLSITTLVRVETRASAVALSTLEARQNALLAAYIAVGELQRAVGPDQRVTARADLLAGTDVSKQNFTGVWSSAPGASGNPLRWLSSDWEASIANYATLPAPAAGASAVTLVGAGSADLTANPEDAVRVSLAATRIEGSGSESGSYAWWVSDENTKASIRPVLPASTGGASDARFRAVLSLGNKDAADLATLPAFTADTVDREDLRKVQDSSAMELVGYDVDGVRAHFHDFTVAAYGVLANTRDGGLKKDLSLAFELSDAAFNNSEFAAGGPAPVPVLGTSLRAQPIFYDANGGRGPSWHLLRDYYTIYQRMQNPLTNPVFPAQHFRPNHEDFGFPAEFSSAEGERQGLLAASRLDMHLVQALGSEGDPLLSDALPYLIRANYMPYVQRWTQTMGLVFEETDPPASNPEGYSYHEPRVHVNPAFVLHNPYNVAVQHYGMLTIINHIRFKIRYTSLLEGGPSGTERTAGNWSMLKVESGSMNPGEAKIYRGINLFDLFYSPEGVPVAEDFFEPLFADFTNFKIPYDPNAPEQPNLEVDFLPYYDDSESWVIWQLHNTGSSTQPILANYTRKDNLFHNTFSYSAYLGTNSILQNIHGDWLRNADRTPTTMTTSDHLQADDDAPKPFMSVNDYLKPVDDSLAYPTHTHASPHAPMKGVTNSLNGEGYPVFGPAWQLTIEKANITLGQAVMDSSNSGLNAFWGDSYGFSGSEKTGLLELPVVPPTSIGQLQSANLSTLATMPALAVGNSFATPYLPRDQIEGAFNNISGQRRLYHDLSYYLNETLWDDYFFSSYSIPYNVNADDFDSVFAGAGVSFDAAFDPGFSNAALYTGSLPNPRMRLLLWGAESLGSAKGKLFDSANEARAEGVGRSAENLLVEGAFNVNSTSVDAWAAVLAAGRGGSVYRSSGGAADTLEPDETAVARADLPAEGQFSGGSTRSDAAWSGYRTLSDAQVRLLAENIVAELRARVDAQAHPFLSMGAFVNRSLSNNDIGLAGLIQAAIDRSDLNDAFESTRTLNASDLSQSVGVFPEPGNIEQASGGRAAGMSAAAHINQADILQGIGSFLQVRSDTFRIRSYGDVRDPLSGEVVSQAWCEMLVQRIPEPVHPSATDPATDPDYWVPDPARGDFGRRFEIISVRFLSEHSV